MQDGQLTRGWAVIAYPAEYGVSGIMSLLCSSGGDVYQQDLGDATDTAVAKIDSFDPVSVWKKVEDGPPKTAVQQNAAAKADEAAKNAAQ